MVPYPGSRGLFLWGSPFWISRETDQRQLETKRAELETVLNRLTAQANDAVLS